MPRQAGTLLSVFLLCLVAELVLSAPALPSDVIYKYIDDDGTINFTEKWHLIPDKYHSRVQTIDPVTGQPFKPPPITTAPVPSRSAPPQAPISSPTGADAPPFYAAWLEQFARLSIPVPSSFKLGVGLTSLVLIVGAFKVMRLSSNLMLKLMLKGMVVLILAGSAYAMYVSGLNERISEATHDPANPTITGKELIKEGQGKVDQARKALGKAATPIEKLKDATVGEVSRTVDRANQANQDKVKALEKIEAAP